MVFINYLLQLASLTLDGLTGASQDRMRAEHKTKAHRMMLAVNFWSMLYLAAGRCMDFNFITKLCFLGEVDVWTLILLLSFVF